MALAIAGAGRDYGVAVAEVNLKLIADLVSSTKVGERGVAYVVDAQDQVIAHPDLSLIRRNVSSLAHVKAARAAGSSSPSTAQVGQDSNGREVLAASTPIPRLDCWRLLNANRGGHCAPQVTPDKRPLMQPELAVDCTNLGRLDQAGMRDRDRVQRPLNGVSQRVSHSRLEAE